ncbi:hypothetical protein ACLOJK_034562 [Asimina triloba]
MDGRPRQGSRSGQGDFDLGSSVCVSGQGNFDLGREDNVCRGRTDADLSKMNACLAGKTTPARQRRRCLSGTDAANLGTATSICLQQTEKKEEAAGGGGRSGDDG